MLNVCIFEIFSKKWARAFSARIQKAIIKFNIALKCHFACASVVLGAVGQTVDFGLTFSSSGGQIDGAVF